MNNATRPDIPFEADAYQAFVRGLRSVWRGDAYRRVVDEAAAHARTNDLAALERAMSGSDAYQLYGWLERRAQQFKYMGHWGMLPTLERQAERLGSLLANAEQRQPDRLHLDPEFELPSYVVESETHQHPGGTWSDDIDAFVFEWATEGISFSMLDSERPQTWYAEYLADTFAPRRVLDVGCSAGKSSRALKAAMPDAEVNACDVSAPFLKLAHLRALENNLQITFWQRCAERLGFEDGYFDLVTSYWLFHEMPTSAIRAAFREMRRVIRTGGTIALYDMYLVPGGNVGAWLHAGFAARNNEPFALAFAQMDLEQELHDAGFGDVKIDISDVQKGEIAGMDELPAARTHFMSVATATAD